MAACAGDRAAVEPGGVENASNASASATEGRANVYVLEETTPGSILMTDADPAPPDARYTINYTGLASRLLEVYGDIGEVDFLIVLPTKPLFLSTAYVANRSVSGIGSCDPCTFAPLPQVKNIVGMAYHAAWQSADTVGLDPMVFFPAFMNSLLHELGHTWLVTIDNFGTGYPGHYQNTLDLFYGDSTYSDPLAYSHWIVTDTSEVCVYRGAPGTTARFSDLSLYLMGFIPPWDVAPVTQHEFLPRFGNDAYNAIGPRCGEPHKFTKKRVVSIEDIIARHGVRSPSYLESQKHFRAMFVVVHPAGEVPSSGFLKYASTFADSLPASWASATRGLSSIKIVPYVRTSELQP